MARMVACVAFGFCPSHYITAAPASTLAPFVHSVTTQQTRHSERKIQIDNHPVDSWFQYLWRQIIAVPCVSAPSPDNKPLVVVVSSELRARSKVRCQGVGPQCNILSTLHKLKDSYIILFIKFYYFDDTNCQNWNLNRARESTFWMQAIRGGQVGTPTETHVLTFLH